MRHPQLMLSTAKDNSAILQQVRVLQHDSTFKFFNHHSQLHHLIPRHLFFLSFRNCSNFVITKNLTAFIFSVQSIISGFFKIGIVLIRSAILKFMFSPWSVESY